MAREDGNRPVQLFQQHDPRELMGPGRWAESQQEVGALFKIARQAVRPANEEISSSAAIIAPAPEPLSEGFAGKGMPTGVERNPDGVPRHEPEQSGAFLGNTILGTTR